MLGRESACGRIANSENAFMEHEAIEAFLSAVRASGLTPGAPCPADDINAAGVALGQPVPGDLAELHGLADGYFDESGQWFVIWPLQRVVHDKLESWKAGTLAPDLLAFGDDGTGDPFCRAVAGDQPAEIVRWTGSTELSRSEEGTLADFLRNWVGVNSWPPSAMA